MKAFQWVGRAQARLLRPALAALATGLAVLVPLGPLASPVGAAPAATTAPFPAASAAAAAAGWLASQLSPGGSMASAFTPGAVDYTGTANTVLALAATRTGAAQAQAALTYLAAHVNQAADDQGADGAGQLGTLILAVRATGGNPSAFGGTDLVARLLATQQASGLFGSQDPTFDGAFRQGLALAALAAAGKTMSTDAADIGPATNWLKNQQCGDGGWTAYRGDTNTPCPAVDPNNGAGPDTNSTALAVEGLAAQKVTPTTDPIGWLAQQQNSDGGFPYFGGPGQASDANSTALVIQGLVALGVNPATDSRFLPGGNSPVHALLALQVPCVGGVAFQPNSDGTLTGNVLATEQAVPALAGVALPFGPNVVAAGLAGAPCPYWMAGADGTVYAFGAKAAGGLGGHPLNAPIVGMAATPDGKGYWLVGADGGVYAIGSATFYGSAGNLRLTKPIVGMAATPDGAGYWLVASDGGVFAFGDAAFHGTTATRVLNRPIVGLAATPDGNGYWLVASDGGVFAFGSATFEGSTGGLRLNQPVVAMAASPDGKGYWLVASDGGVFAFGTAPFLGSLGSIRLNRPVVTVALTVDGRGYWLAASDGGIFAFGTAGFFGSAAASTLPAPVVAMAPSPAPSGP